MQQIQATAQNKYFVSVVSSYRLYISQDLLNESCAAKNFHTQI